MARSFGRTKFGVRSIARHMVIGVAAVVASLGFVGVFRSWSFVPAVVVGVAGVVVTVFALAVARPDSESAANDVLESILACLVVGVAIAPTAISGVPWAFGVFFSGLTQGWSDVISTAPPLDDDGGLRALPYSIGWLGATMGTMLLRVRRVPGVSAAGSFAAFALASLVTLERRDVALAQGAVLALVPLCLIAIGIGTQSGSSDAEESATLRLTKSGNTVDVGAFSNDRRSRLIALAAATAIAVMAVFIGPRLPLASANERFDLREVTDPPFDPLEHPSPLGQVKAALQEVNADVVMFDVASDVPISRFPMAVLDYYTNEFWAVGKPGEASARFGPVDSRFPDPVDAEIDGRDVVTATITIEGLSDIAGGEFDPPWLPTIGWPISIESDAPIDLRFDPRTGTVALPGGVDGGLTYELVAAVEPETDDIELAGVPTVGGERYDLAVPQLRNFASDVLEGKDSGWEQVDAVRSRLVDTGAYDSRAGSTTARPGHYLGRLAEFVNDPEQLAGFEEQYAATAALIVRSAGLPARVVVGFDVPAGELAERWTDGHLEVRADDIAAWVEVRFEEVGWIPFDVTPPRDRPPNDVENGVDRKEVAVPNPPVEPPPPVVPPELDTDTPETTVPTPPTTVPPDAGPPIDWGRYGVAAGATLPVIALIAAAATIVLLKRRRTSRRRQATTPTARIGGAWREVSDRYDEVGLRRPSHATPTEYVRGVGAARGADDATVATLIGLANDLDEAVYHPLPRTREQADAAWRRSDEVIASIRSSEGRFAAWRRTLDPRPLLREERELPEPTAHDPLNSATDQAAQPDDRGEDVHV